MRESKEVLRILRHVWVKLIVFVGVAVLCATGVQAEGKRNLYPEFSDPVLGARAAVVEWAWSPQYAKRFGLPVQKDGLKNGPLWLLGVKIKRKQYKDYQIYECSILGLIENRTDILTPPGDSFVSHPSDPWMGDLPGKPQGTDISFMVKERGLQDYSPRQASWWKPGTKEPKPVLPESSISMHYISFHRHYLPDLAFFELNGGCSYFRAPGQLRNEIRFPVRQNEVKSDASMLSSHPVAFDLPDDLMRRIYQYTNDAASWSSCLMRRIGGKSNTLRIGDHERFGNACEPVTGLDINR